MTNKDVVNAVAQSLCITNVNWDCANSCFFNYDGNFVTLTFYDDCVTISFNELSSRRAKGKITFTTFDTTVEQNISVLHRHLSEMACLLKNKV